MVHMNIHLIFFLRRQIIGGVSSALAYTIILKHAGELAWQGIDKYGNLKESVAL